MTAFLPRAAFDFPSTWPRSYFSGHHASAQGAIKLLLNTISMVVECRDYRLPLTTRNPNLDFMFGNKPRLVVYTKSDLGIDSGRGPREALQRVHGADGCLFWDQAKAADTKALLGRLHDAAEAFASPVGMRVLVVGMPNVGKSSLLNALHANGTAALAAQRNPYAQNRTRRRPAPIGDMPGVTRRIPTAVRVLPADDGRDGGGVFVLDTPGIFMPHVAEPETMFKLALAHGIKRGLIPDIILADYLLYHLNHRDPELYERYHHPTNDIDELLNAMACKEGKLRKGGEPDLNEAASRLITLWRLGKLGRYVLDDLDDGTLAKHELHVQERILSIRQRRLARLETQRKKAREVNEAAVKAKEDKKAAKEERRAAGKTLAKAKR